MQSLTNVLSLHSNSSVSSKHKVIAVSNLGALKKNNLKPDTSGLIFPTGIMTNVKFPTPGRNALGLPGKGGRGVKVPI